MASNPESQSLLDYDNTALTRLFDTPPPANHYPRLLPGSTFSDAQKVVKADTIAFIKKVLAPCTTPGNEFFLGDLRVGLPALCAYAASIPTFSDSDKKDANQTGDGTGTGGATDGSGFGIKTGGVSQEAALSASCLTQEQFVRGLGLVQRAAGLRVTSITWPPPPDPPRYTSKKPSVPTTGWRPGSGTNGSASASKPKPSPSPHASPFVFLSSSLSAGASGSGSGIMPPPSYTSNSNYSILEPLFSPNGGIIDLSSKSRVRANGSGASAPNVNGSGTPGGGGTLTNGDKRSMSSGAASSSSNGPSEERPKKKRRVSEMEKDVKGKRKEMSMVEENQSLRERNFLLEDKNTTLKHQLHSLQYLIHQERFKREERDIDEHNELTTLRTALVVLLPPPAPPPDSPTTNVGTNGTPPTLTPTPKSDLQSQSAVSKATGGTIKSADDAIAAVETMARRRLLITNLHDVDTYDKDDHDHGHDYDQDQDRDRDGDGDGHMDVDRDTPSADGSGGRNMGMNGSTSRSASHSRRRGRPKKGQNISAAGGSAEAGKASLTTAAMFDEGCIPDAGTMVWAHVGSSPWYPAAVKATGPPDAMEAKPKREGVVLVNFYDEKAQWGWCSVRSLRMFGYDQALDDDMIAEKSKLQKKWPSAKERGKVREAYQAACKELAPETDDEMEGEAGGQHH